MNSIRAAVLLFTFRSVEGAALASAKLAGYKMNPSIIGIGENTRLFSDKQGAPRAPRLFFTWSANAANIVDGIRVEFVDNPTPRKWTDSSGKYTVEAEFVEFKDGKVRLRKPDAKVVAVPIEKLSQADQAFVEARAGETKETTKEQDAAKANAWPPPYVGKEIPNDLLKWVGKRGKVDLSKQGNYYTFTITKPGAKPVNMELVVFANPIPVEELTKAFGKPDRIVDDALLGLQFKGVKDKAALEGQAYDYGAVRLLVKDQEVRELRCAFPLSFN